MVLAMFSDGSFAVDPPRAYFLYEGDEPGAYVFPTITAVMEVIRDPENAKLHMRLERQITGGNQRVVWESPPPVPVRKRRNIR